MSSSTASTVFLNETGHRTAQHDGKDDARTDPFLENQRNRGAEGKDQDQRAFELPQQNPERAELRCSLQCCSHPGPHAARPPDLMQDRPIRCPVSPPKWRRLGSSRLRRSSRRQESGLRSIARDRHHQTTVPNSAPIPALNAMENEPQKVLSQHRAYRSRCPSRRQRLQNSPPGGREDVRATHPAGSLHSWHDRHQLRLGFRASGQSRGRALPSPMRR